MASSTSDSPLHSQPSPTNASETIVTADNFEDAEVAHIVSLIADMIERLIAHNDQIPLSSDSLTRFHSRTPPSISVLEYLQRIVRYANIERSCLLITLHYIDLICTRLPRFTITSLTVHRFLISSVAVSSKALCDVFCTNTHYAKVGGIKLAELNILEREFLSAIDWRLTCTRELLQSYYVNLVRTHSTGGFQLASPREIESKPEPVEERDTDGCSLTEASDSDTHPMVAMDEGDETATHPSSASIHEDDDEDLMRSGSSTPSSSSDDEDDIIDQPTHTSNAFDLSTVNSVLSPSAAVMNNATTSTPRSSAKRDFAHVVDLSADTRPKGRRRLDEWGNPTS